MDGAELKRLRRRAGLTQEALAARLGVDTNTLARWEQGVHGVSKAMSKLIRLTLPTARRRKGG